MPEVRGYDFLMRTAGLLVLCLVWAGCSSVDTSAPLLLSDQFNEPLEERTTLVEPRSSAAGLKVGQSIEYQLAHCGVMSPIDVDGSLWDPRTGHDGRGRALHEGQLTELVNGTRGTFTLRALDLAEFRTPRGAVVQLHRVPERAYRGCS